MTKTDGVYPVPPGRFVRISLAEPFYEELYDVTADQMVKVKCIAHAVRLFTADEIHLVATGCPKVEVGPGLWAIHNYDIEN